MDRSLPQQTVRRDAFQLAPALVLTGLVTASTALPEWIPDWRRRWPVQGLIIAGAAATIALPPDPVAPGTAEASWSLAEGAEPVAGEDTTQLAEHPTEAELPSTAQGLDEPEIPWQRIVFPGVVLLAAGAAGGLWLERQAIAWVARRGVSHPRTALALAAVPVNWWALRHDVLDG